MKTLHRLTLVVAIISGCAKPTQMKLISDARWSVGEAKNCTIDGQWNEGHCFPPSSKHPETYPYLVSVVFEKPLTFDAEHWAYNVVCRLDSFSHATCIQQQPQSKD